ncbi:hypothetical protein UFOVP1634_25 [uncultured Caudovirales phage]|uniref:Uncharacterized protein n=1 Tax=uncultured Caudovirales phage TaxID=2100421 RepID=A0A6J5QC25_9CAUD|nr:hypothetical protein UFOVP1030_16 [uncultured Caudovirales phage]CAB4220387.1 hypothetical protein UFOVP1634_25 [uncultured Caudovirales phage]
MNDEYWNTGWDPHQSLVRSEHNIIQCAQAINSNNDSLKILTAKINHQQEVIQQLMFNDKKVSQQLNVQATQITALLTEITLLKSLSQ